jgi:alpha-glucosidase
LHDITGGEWWRGAAIYELYVQSFADGNGDGLGDLAGVRARLPYLAELGIDAIWFTPWYPSPLADAGYDVADYRAIAPAFGTLDAADVLIQEAHAHTIKIIIDIVPNHCSDQHAWFQAALAAAPGSPERARFWFRPGRGPGGDEPPNNWPSRFGGPAWTRVPDGEWYLHMFAPEQPDFNWANPQVRAEFEDILRFWFDRGADGIRIDTAGMLTKDPALPDLDGTPGQHPYVDRDDVHDIYRAWRAIANEYTGKVLIGEIWLADAARLARYTRPDELHSVFNFPYLSCPWDAAKLRAVIDETLAQSAPPNWVLSNHDTDRHVSRYGRSDTSFDLDNRNHTQSVDLELGTRRARAAALLTMALPGAAYIYQGEELGLWEVEDIPDDRRRDPIWKRTGGKDPGRDGSRVPLPWSGVEPPFGFSTGLPWLPQPKEWREVTVEAESADLASMLELYRTALRIRRGWAANAALTWRPAPDGVLDFGRGDGVRCVANLSGAPVARPADGTVLLASGPLAGATLPADTTIWLQSLVITALVLPPSSKDEAGSGRRRGAGPGRRRGRHPDRGARPFRPSRDVVPDPDHPGGGRQLHRPEQRVRLHRGRVRRGRGRDGVSCRPVLDRQPGRWPARRVRVDLPGLSLGGVHVGRARRPPGPGGRAAPRPDHHVLVGRPAGRRRELLRRLRHLVQPRASHEGPARLRRADGVAGQRWPGPPVRRTRRPRRHRSRRHRELRRLGRPARFLGGRQLRHDHTSDVGDRPGRSRVRPRRGPPRLPARVLLPDLRRSWLRPVARRCGPVHHLLRCPPLSPS